MFVVGVDIVADGGFETVGAAEGPAANPLVGEHREPAFDLVEPGGACRREVEIESWVLEQPPLNELGLVRAVVVEHDVQIEFLRN